MAIASSSSLYDFDYEDTGYPEYYKVEDGSYHNSYYGSTTYSYQNYQQRKPYINSVRK